MKIFSVFVLSAIWLTSSQAQNAALDRQGQKVVTVRSELIRGIHAASLIAFDEGNVRTFVPTVSEVMARNIQANTDSGGFVAGFYFLLWIKIDQRGETLRKDLKNKSSPDLFLTDNAVGLALSESRNRYFPVFRVAQTELKLKDSELCEISGVSYSEIGPRLIKEDDWDDWQRKNMEKWNAEHPEHKLIWPPDR